MVSSDLDPWFLWPTRVSRKRHIDRYRRFLAQHMRVSNTQTDTQTTLRAIFAVIRRILHTARRRYDLKIGKHWAILRTRVYFLQQLIRAFSGGSMGPNLSYYCYLFYYYYYYYYYYYCNVGYHIELFEWQHETMTSHTKPRPPPLGMRCWLAAAAAGLLW